MGWKFDYLILSVWNEASICLAKDIIWSLDLIRSLWFDIIKYYHLWVSLPDYYSFVVLLSSTFLRFHGNRVFASSASSGRAVTNRQKPRPSSIVSYFFKILEICRDFSQQNWTEHPGSFWSRRGTTFIKKMRVENSLYIYVCI